MDLRPEDIQIDHYDHGPGNGSSWKMTHLPTGLSVSESAPADSRKGFGTFRRRLRSALTLKIQERFKDNAA